MNLSQTVAKRWALVNRNTGSVRRTLATRALAREVKRPTERIFDNMTLEFVR